MRATLQISVKNGVIESRPGMCVFAILTCVLLFLPRITQINKKTLTQGGSGASFGAY